MKWAKDLNRQFSKEGIQMAKRVHEKVLNITNHQGNANQTSMRYHLKPVRMDVIKMTGKNCWQGYGEKRTLVHC